jgi:glycosyltransferase involved in cell wall biosynthesis
MPVDVLFDARHIRQSGIGTYIKTQLPYLEQSSAERRLSLAILSDRSTLPTVGESTRVIFSTPAGAPMYSAQEQKAWDNALEITRPSAIWLPHYPFPVALFRKSNRRIRTFVTVHDTIHLRERRVSNQSWPHRMYARAMLHLDARMCSRIFTPSLATASSLIQVAPSAPVLVTPIPVDESWFAPLDANLSPIHGPYILYVGNVKRHKNLPVLLKAYAEVALAIPQKLVIAGGGESLRTLDERIDQLAAGLGDRVHVTGRLDFNTLRSLVAGADVLIIPSLHEGAGLPPLEAMASHTAVLSSNIPALKETCGDGADYFDPHDYRTLAHLVHMFCVDDHARARLAARGWSHVTKRQAAISFAAAADAVCSEFEGSPP